MRPTARAPGQNPGDGSPAGPPSSCRLTRTRDRRSFAGSSKATGGATGAVVGATTAASALGTIRCDTITGEPTKRGATGDAPKHVPKRKEVKVWAHRPWLQRARTGPDATAAGAGHGGGAQSPSPPGRCGASPGRHRTIKGMGARVGQSPRGTARRPSRRRPIAETPAFGANGQPLVAGLPASLRFPRGRGALGDYGPDVRVTTCTEAGPRGLRARLQRRPCIHPVCFDVRDEGDLV